MNDYEKLVEDVDHAIDVTEAAWCNAVDEEDVILLEEALDRLRAVKTRAEEKV